MKHRFGHERLLIVCTIPELLLILRRSYRLPFSCLREVFSAALRISGDAAERGPGDEGYKPAFWLCSWCLMRIRDLCRPTSPRPSLLTSPSGLGEGEMQCALSSFVLHHFFVI